MSVTKKLIEKEKDLVKAGQVRNLHLHREGTFIRAYDWSAWLACRYLHDFKVNKRAFKGIDEPVAYIGFPETNLTVKLVKHVLFFVRQVLHFGTCCFS